MIFAVLVIVSMTAFAQVSKEEQELIDLSNQKWTWMAEKNADRLAELFLDNAQFVHMGGGWGKQQEVDIIRGGMIWYKHADIHSQEVKFTDKNVGTVYSNIHLTSEVGGHQVRFPFMVSEVYIRQPKGWGLSSLVFTKLAEPDPRFEPALTLGEGLRMPQFGLGTYQMSNEQAKASVLAALRMGYRHIDTAHAYQDERGVGEAVKESGIPRQDLWITSKLWPSEYGEGKTCEAIDKMLERLQTDYIDLLYVHQPMGDFVGAWKDMEKAVRAGKVRALGISNFDANDSVFNLIMANAEIKPVALQIECHPYAQRQEGGRVRLAGGVLVPAGWCHESRGIAERPRHCEDCRASPQVARTGHSPLALAGRSLRHPRLAQPAAHHGECPDIRLRPLRCRHAGHPLAEQGAAFLQHGLQAGRTVHAELANRRLIR